MMKAAVEAARGSGVQLLAVTVLTSFGESDLSEIGVSPSAVEKQVLRLARLAIDSGLTGLVCSPHEISMLRSDFKDQPQLTLVTPGVRPAGSDQGDQRRVMTPGEAFRLGTSHIVVGRPILQATDPDALVDSILAGARATKFA
jgi:orotidine-5'-phosphate decarboxylase